MSEGRSHSNSDVTPRLLDERESIYFVTTKEGPYVKIGRARDVAARLVALQTGNPDKLMVLDSLPGSRKHEQRFHRMLDDYRHNGEWFAGGDWIDTIISALRDSRDVEEVLRRMAAAQTEWGPPSC